MKHQVGVDVLTSKQSKKLFHFHQGKYLLNNKEH